MFLIGNGLINQVIGFLFFCFSFGLLEFGNWNLFGICDLGFNFYLLLPLFFFLVTRHMLRVTKQSHGIIIPCLRSAI